MFPQESLVSALMSHSRLPCPATHCLTPGLLPVPIVPLPSEPFLGDLLVEDHGQGELTEMMTVSSFDDMENCFINN